MKVDITKLKGIMEYLASIEQVPLAEIIWIKDGKILEVKPEDIKEWKFTGLNNRYFAMWKLL